MTLVSHSGHVFSLASCSENCLASGSSGKSVHIWNTTNGKVIQTMAGHPGEVWSLAVLRYGSSLASGSSDFDIRIWCIRTGELIKELTGHGGSILHCKFFMCINTSENTYMLKKYV